MAQLDQLISNEVILVVACVTLHIRGELPSPQRSSRRSPLSRTFSHVEVDVLGHPQLQEGGEPAVLLQRPGEEVLVAVGEALLQDLGRHGEVPRLEAHLRALRHLRGRGGRGGNVRGRHRETDTLTLSHLADIWTHSDSIVRLRR